MQYSQCFVCSHIGRNMHKFSVFSVPVYFTLVLSILLCTNLIKQINCAKMSEQKYFSASNKSEGAGKVQNLFEKITRNGHHFEKLAFKQQQGKEDEQNSEFHVVAEQKPVAENLEAAPWPAIDLEQNREEILSTPTSSENEIIDFPVEYWIRVAQAKALAIVVENGVFPRIDESSEIIKPAGCLKDDDRQCNDFTSTCAETKANITLKKLKNHSQVPEKDHVAQYVTTILQECGFLHDHQSRRHNNQLTVIPPPARTPAPHPIFHCNSYQGRDNVHINFRMDYKENKTVEHLPSDEIPRYFVIETRNGGKWVLAAKPVQAYWLFEFGTETNAQFQVRVTAVSPKYVYPPVTSAAVNVYPSSQLSKYNSSPAVVRPAAVSVDEAASRPSPSAFVRWRSGSGYNASCDWDVYYMSDEALKVERKNSVEAFWVKLQGLEFEKNYKVLIIERLGGEEVESESHFYVHSCSLIRKDNTDLCLPPPPNNLRIENATDYSFWAAWDAPTYPNKTSGRNLQYNVTVEWVFSTTPVAFPALDGRVQGAISGFGGPSAATPQGTLAPTSYITQRLFGGIVPGNVTTIPIRNTTQVRGKIKLSVVTMGPGGMSKTAWKMINYRGAEHNPWSSQKIAFYILAPCLLVGLVVLMGVSKRIQDRRQRNKDRKKKFEDYEIRDSLEMRQLTEKPSSKWEIDWCNLSLKDKVIGEGNFGQVRCGILTQSGKQMMVAVKTLRDGVDKKEVEKLWEEYEILKNLDPHVHVVGLKGIVIKYVPQPLLVVEYCDGGNLLFFLRDMFQAAGFGLARRHSPAGSMLSCSGNSAHSVAHAGESSTPRMAINAAYFLHSEGDLPVVCSTPPPLLTVGDLLSFARQVSVGMEYLSNNKIVHRDLAARNILISGRSRILKIADFGLSRDVYEQNWYKQTSKGDIPIKWLAKECILNGIYTTKSDVWAFGILLWEIFTFGGNPYPGVENKAVFHLLKEGYRMPQPDFCPDQIYALMRSCWRDDPNARPDFTACRLMLEDIVQEITHVTYLNLEPNTASSKDSRYKNCDSGFGNYEGSGSSEGEAAPALPPRNKRTSE